MMNMNNYGITTGRLTRDPAIYANSDGSHKVKMTIAAQNNYRNKTTGERAAQFLPLECYVPADGTMNVFDYMHKGDKVTIQYTVKNTQYKDNQDKDIYGVILCIENIRLDETKSNTDTRRNTTGARTRKTTRTRKQ